MKPVLGILRQAKPNPDHEHTLAFPIKLTQDEFEKYLKAKDNLNDFLSNAELFQVVVLNCREYYDALATGLTLYADKNREIFDYREFYLTINRYFLNWLSSVRSFLDHNETRIKRKYGDDSQNWKTFQNSCSREYDSNFSYRFLYKLRNYTQHCGFPITQINFESIPDDTDSEKFAYTVWVGCNRDTLLTRFKEWKQPLKTEIPKLAPLIEINQHIDSMVRSLERINLDNLKQEFSELYQSAIFIKGLFQRVEGEDIPEVFEIEATEDETGKILSITQINVHTTPLAVVEAVINNNLEDLIGDFIVPITD